MLRTRPSRRKGQACPRTTAQQAVASSKCKWANMASSRESRQPIRQWIRQGSAPRLLQTRAERKTPGPTMDPNALQQARKPDQLKDTSNPEHKLCSLFLADECGLDNPDSRLSLSSSNCLVAIPSESIRITQSTFWQPMINPSIYLTASPRMGGQKSRTFASTLGWEGGKTHRHTRQHPAAGTLVSNWNDTHRL